MLKWLTQYRRAHPQTQYFIMMFLFYGVMLIASTIYCYARLDYVRSYKTSSPHVEKKMTETIIEPLS